MIDKIIEDVHDVLYSRNTPLPKGVRLIYEVENLSKFRKELQEYMDDLMKGFTSKSKHKDDVVEVNIPDYIKLMGPMGYEIVIVQKDLFK